MEYYDEVVEIEDKPGHVKPIMESGVIGNTFHDDIEESKPTVTKKKQTENFNDPIPRDTKNCS